MTSSWQRKDMSPVVAILTVALLGLQAGLADDSWPGTSLLHASAIDLITLLHDLSSEIRLHLIDIVEDCKLEAV